MSTASLISFGRFATIDIRAAVGWGGGMNTTEAIMSSNTDQKRFVVLDLALRAAGAAIALVNRVRAVTWRLLHPKP